MATKTPGIYFSEIDNTEYRNPSAEINTTVAIIGFAKKGPIGVPTEITTYNDYKTKFGTPIDGQYAGLAIRNVLSAGGTVLFTRVADTTIATKSISSQCREEYLRDITDITSEFSRNLNGVMQGYIYPLSTILNELGLDSPDYLNFEYEGKSIKDIPINLAHLNDRIVIQEAVTAEQNALMVKTHSTSVILDAINAFDASEALRERYYNASYNMDISSDLDIFNNNLLQKSRENSEEAYRQAKINLFKLLDSSVELMKDISSKKLEAQQAKAILLKNGINIYEHKIFETTGVNNAAGTTNAKNLVGTGGGTSS